MRWLSTAWFWLVVLVTLPLGYVVCLALEPLLAPKGDVHRHWLMRFVNTWCHDYLSIWPFWRVRVEGVEQLPTGPCVMVANHQSITDILALMGLPKPFHFVSKASLFDVPLVGPMMRRLGHVSLQRGSTASTDAMMKACDTLLAAGESVLVFPEGTYAPEPKRLPFKRGAFLLAQRHDVPLVLVLLTGTSDLALHDGPFFALRADVRVRVMAVERAPPGLDDAGWAKSVAERYRQWLGGPPTP